MLFLHAKRNREDTGMSAIFLEMPNIDVPMILKAHRILSIESCIENFFLQKKNNKEIAAQGSIN